MHTSNQSNPTLSLPPQPTAHPAIFSSQQIKFHPQTTPINPNLKSVSPNQQKTHLPLNQQQIFNNQMAQTSVPQMFNSNNSMNQSYHYSQMQPQNQHQHQLPPPMQGVPFYIMNNNPNHHPNLTNSSNNINTNSNAPVSYYSPSYSSKEQINMVDQSQYFYRQQQQQQQQLPLQQQQPPYSPQSQLVNSKLFFLFFKKIKNFN